MGKTGLILAIGVAGSIAASCKQSGAGGATAASGNLSGGGGDRCTDARLIAAPATIAGDLTNRHDDSNARIAVTGYSWAGRDEFYAMDLQAGQTLTFVLDDGSRFDGGLYVFRSCGDIPGTTVGGLDTNPQRPFVFAAPAAGRYIVAVDAWIANTGGAYTLTITQGGTPTPP